MQNYAMEHLIFGFINARGLPYLNICFFLWYPLTFCLQSHIYIKVDGVSSAPCTMHTRRRDDGVVTFFDCCNFEHEKVNSNTTQ